MDVIISFTMEIQMHTGGLNVARIASPIYAMVMGKFSPVFGIDVFFEKGIMTLTLHSTFLRHHVYSTSATEYGIMES